MNNKIQFGRFEAITFMINSICSRLLLNFPRPFAESAGTAAWIQVLYSCTIALLLFIIIERLFKRFEGMDIIDISEYMGGNVGRIIIGTIIIALLAFAALIVLREYAENMKIISLNISPVSFVMMFFLIGMIVASLFGIEALVRLHAVAVPVITVLSLALAFGVMPLIDITNYFPLLGEGLGSIFMGGIPRLSFFGPIVYLFFIPPFLRTHSNFKIAGYTGLGISCILLLTWTVIYTGVTPYPTNTEYFIPSYQLARLINYGRFFQRVETFFMLSWAMSGLLYLSTIFFFTTYCFKKVYKLEYQRPLIWPFAVIIFSLSLYPQSLIASLLLEVKYYTQFTWIIVFILPMIVLLVSNIKKKKSAGGSSDG